MAIIPSLGVTLSVDGDNIEQLTSLTPPQQTVTVVPTQFLVNGRKVLSLGGFDAGSISFGVRHDPAEASHVTLLGLINSGAEAAWVVEYPDGTTDTFQGRLTQHNMSGTDSVDNALSTEYTVEISGAITRVAA